MFPVWALPRLGVAVRNDLYDLRLRSGEREVRYSPTLGWRLLEQPQLWPAPQMVSGSLYVPLEVLTHLGVPLLADGEMLDFAAPASVPLTNLPPTPVTEAPRPAAPAVSAAPERLSMFLPVPAQAVSAPSTSFLHTVRVNTEMHRAVEVRRLVLELTGSGKPRFDLQSHTAGGLTIRLPGAAATSGTQALSSGEVLTLESGAGGTSVRLSHTKGETRAFALNDPPRVVLDTVRQTDPDVPPPLNPAALPSGVTYRQLGGLHLLSFDPQRFEPRIVSAAQGLGTVDKLVQSVGGVAGVNASYFALASGLPVDLVVRGGLMLSPSLEKRGTVGFLPSGGLRFGYPRPRYHVGNGESSVYANSVTASARPDWLTAFVGDGKAVVGREGMLTLHLDRGLSRVTLTASGPHVPPDGTLTLTFDPQLFPQLPQRVGVPLGVTLDWRSAEAGWDGLNEALSAGPLLVAGGRPVTDPQREGFNTATNIWRPTRQVALGLWRGQPTIAYFEHGTPEAFASALAGAGLSDALRLDSGSSATVYAGAGYGSLGGYLNTVWSRPVPNAVVFVKR